MYEKRCKKNYSSPRQEYIKICLCKTLLQASPNYPEGELPENNNYDDFDW